jgi:hypothetical protein
MLGACFLAAIDTNRASTHSPTGHAGDADRRQWAANSSISGRDETVIAKGRESLADCETAKSDNAGQH